MRCVYSILRQNVDVRVLILDDASSDETPEIARLLLSDSRVEYRRSETNQGAVRTFNTGLEWASAEFTQLVSADDYLLPGSLMRAIQAFEDNKQVGFAFGNALGFLNEPRCRANACDRSVITILGQDFIEEVCERGANPVCGSTVTVRTAVQKSVGLYEERLPYTHDMEMWLRLAARCSAGYINCDQGVYGIHGGNMTNSYKGLADVVERRAAVWSFLSKANLPAHESRRLQDKVDPAFQAQALYAAERLVDSPAWQHDGRRAMARITEIWPSVVCTRAYQKMWLRDAIGPTKFSVIRRLVRSGRLLLRRLAWMNRNKN